MTSPVAGAMLFRVSVRGGVVDVGPDGGTVVTAMEVLLPPTVP
jgi:hypothetical protein